MKKYFITFIAAVAALAACNKNVAPDVVPSNSDEMGIISVSIDSESAPATKAVTAYTTAQAYEQQINKVQICVFYSGGSQNGNLAAFGTVPSGSIDNSSSPHKATYSAQVPAGTYTVAALVNGPDLTAAQKATLSAFNAVAVSLGANSTTASTGFVMSGSSSATVTAGGTNNCAITVSRLTNRIAVQKITNGLASGSLVVTRMWLANVITSQNLTNSLNGSGRVWAHQFSRKASPWNAAAPDGIITAAASGATLAYKAVTSADQTIANGGNLNKPANYLLYAYANFKSANTAEDAKIFVGDPSTGTTWAATQTRLVIEASINSVTYYYPVDINLGNRNQAHTVEMTISGPGLTDPQGDPSTLSKSALSVTVSVANWVDGDEYEISY